MEYSCNSTQFNSTINIGLIHQPQQPFWVNLKMFLWEISQFTSSNTVEISECFTLIIT